jgi:hypothetical protein
MLNDTIKLMVVILFGVMGLWLGADGFAEWHWHQANDERWSNDFGYLVFIIILWGGSAAALLNSLYEKEPSRLFYIEVGVFLSSSFAIYGYMAGPGHEAGSILSPWLMFPMAGMLAVAELPPAKKVLVDILVAAKKRIE